MGRRSTSPEAAIAITKLRVAKPCLTGRQKLGEEGVPPPESFEVTLASALAMGRSACLRCGRGAVEGPDPDDIPF